MMAVGRGRCVGVGTFCYRINMNSDVHSYNCHTTTTSMVIVALLRCPCYSHTKVLRGYFLLFNR